MEKTLKELVTWLLESHGESRMSPHSKAAAQALAFIFLGKTCIYVLTQFPGQGENQMPFFAPCSLHPGMST